MASKPKAPKRPNKSPLAPLTPKQIMQQAKRTMRSVYKPAFKQLGREEMRTNAISEKRKADNAYYLNWLDKASAQLDAHQQSADALLQQRGNEIQEDLTKGYEGMRDKLLATGESTPGVISKPGDATAFDVSEEAALAQQNIANERQRSVDVMKSGGDMNAVVRANNFAVMAAAEARRVADQWKALSQIGDAKQQVRLAKGADTAKEVARLLDREIQKTQIRGEIASSQAQAALEAKRFGLDLSKFQLDLAKFNFDKVESNRNFGLAKKDTLSKIWKRGQDVKGDKRAARQDAVENSRKTTAIIQEGISTIASSPRLQKLLQSDPNKVKRALMKVLGSATAASAAVQLVSRGSLDSQLKKDLKQLGYIIPPRWR